MPTYTYQNFYDTLDGKLHNKITNLTDPRQTINDAVRHVTADLDLRTAKRKAAVSPNIFEDVYDYACPADMKGVSLIDVLPQVNRKIDSEFEMTTEEEFDRMKTINKMMVAFADDAMMRKIRISFLLENDDTLVISGLDSLTDGGGTWIAFGDGTGLSEDNDDFVIGSGSIKWAINAVGGTTAGIDNQGLSQFDITDYISNGSGFVFAKITSATNITNFILKITDSNGKHVTKTVTSDNAGNAFAAGWSLLRFDMATATVDAGFDPTLCIGARVYMTKAGAKISETDYHFDWLVLKRGQIHQILYYSKYPWQTSAGVWIENSTVVGDLLNADTEEFELMLIKAAELGMQELREAADVKYFQNEYRNANFTGKADRYELRHPSEAKLLINEYRDF